MEESEASLVGPTATTLAGGYQHPHVQLIRRRKKKKHAHPALVAVNKEMFEYQGKGDRETLMREVKHSQPPKQ